MSPSCTLIDGKKIAQEIKDEISLHVKRRKEAGKKLPHLAIILAGDDIASQTYVNNKIKTNTRNILCFFYLNHLHHKKKKKKKKKGHTPPQNTPPPGGDRLYCAT